MADGKYSGTENLEAMEVATRYRHFLAMLLDGLARRAGPGGRAIDFGAGTGTYSLAAEGAGLAVTCVEADRDLQRRLVASGFAVSESTLELPAQSFDAVFSFNVLEHIDHDGEALRELFRLTKPGGHLLLYVPAFMVLYGAMDERVGHLRRYRKKGLVAVTGQAGWQVTECFYADSLGFLMALAYRVVGPRHGQLDARSVALYDRWIFPPSRLIDRLSAPVFGKNLILWAQRPPAQPGDNAR